MTKRLTGFMLLLLLVPLVLSGCGYEEPEQGPIKRAPQPQQTASAEAEGAGEAARQVAPLGAKQRNPFQNYILLTRGDSTRVKIRGPLECCELELFRVKGVVVAPENSYALVQAPDGKRYIVRTGFVMGLREGKVIDIDDLGLTVREYARDSKGKVISKTDVVLTLPKKGSAIR